MTSLSTIPGSSTPAQRCTLHRIKRAKGWSDEQLHEFIGAASTTCLSAQAAREHITRFTGRDLPNEPGAKQTEYSGSRPRGTRVILQAHVEQINRLACAYFDGNAQAASAWLKKNWNVHDPWEFGTALRASHVINVLKDMNARKGKLVKEKRPRVAAAVCTEPRP